MRSLIPALVLLASPALADTPVLTFDTYDSFMSDRGPGPQIEAAFEQTCNCDLQFAAAIKADAVAEWRRGLGR